MDAVGPNPKLSASAVPISAPPGKSEILVPASLGERSTDNPELGEVSDNTPSEKTDEVELIKVDSAASLVSALDDNY